jgi:hypothetical protein
VGFFISPYIYLYMKIIITEEQYGHLVTNLLDLLLGNITIKTVKEKKEDGNKEDYHSVFNEDGSEIMTIWVKGGFRSKGCKKDLTLQNWLIEKFESYLPYYRHKIFSKVLVDYIYDKFGIKCDCVQYDYDFKEEKHVDAEGDEYEYTDYKTRKYNVKKKKKIKESVEDSNVVEQIMDDEGIKFKGCEYGGRTYDNFKRQRDMVHLFFTDPIDPDYTHMKTIVFITKNNKVGDVYTSSDFRTITDGFSYISTDVLMNYFIEKGKTYLEGVLSDDSI